MFVRVGREGRGQYPHRTEQPGPLLALARHQAGLAAKLWSGNRKQNFKLLLFAWKLSASPVSEQVCLITERGNGAKYFQSCFPPTCLI